MTQSLAVDSNVDVESVPLEIDFDRAFENADLRSLSVRWVELTGGDQVGHFADFDLLDLADNLKRALIMDVPRTFDEDDVLRVRFIGPEAAHVYGEITGQLTSTAMPPYRQEIWSRAVHAVRDCRHPVRVTSEVQVVDMPPLPVEVLVAPLRSKGHEVDRVLAVFQFAREL